MHLYEICEVVLSIAGSYTVEMNSTNKTIFAALVLIANVGLLPVASADEIRPFTSDGCSVFPDGTYAHRDLWLGCCHAHDLSYYADSPIMPRKAYLTLEKRLFLRDKSA